MVAFEARFAVLANKEENFCHSKILDLVANLLAILFSHATTFDGVVNKHDFLLPRSEFLLATLWKPVVITT